MLKNSESPVKALITALRSPLPEGFCWDFSDCCACGLAEWMGISLDAIDESIGNPNWRDHPCNAVERDGIVPPYGVPARDVTPAMVADALEGLPIITATQRNR